MHKMLSIDYQKCTGCRLCELHCSFAKTKTCNPAKSRIRVIEWEEQAIMVPMACQQCEAAPCQLVCPVNAIKNDQASGLVSINSDSCIGCKMCVSVCPFGAISVDREQGKVFKCDLCAGDPTCAKACPTGAIKFLSADRVALAKKRAALQKLTDIMVPNLEGGK